MAHVATNVTFVEMPNNKWTELAAGVKALATVSIRHLRSLSPLFCNLHDPIIETVEKSESRVYARGCQNQPSSVYGQPSGLKEKKTADSF